MSIVQEYTAKYYEILQPFSREQLLLTGLLMLASLAARLVGLFGIFAKSGHRGWLAFVPFYNQIVLLRLIGWSAWWVVALFLGPLVGLICRVELPKTGLYYVLVAAMLLVNFAMASDLVRVFGKKSPLYLLGVFIFPYLFYPLLGFGKAKYNPSQSPSDAPFYLAITAVSGAYVLLILSMLVADFAYTSPSEMLAALGNEDIQFSIRLSLISCTISAILSVWVAVPIGYLMSRHRFIGRNLLDAVLDIPIVLPPLVVGISLLILFQFLPRVMREAVVYQVPAVILAQFVVACAFAVRTMRATFDQIDDRREQVALTLGCTRMQAFIRVVLPEAWPGVLTAGTLAWARSLGEFGPLLVFAGATRQKTEVLSTTVYLELSIGNLEAAVAVSLIMVFAAVAVLIVARLWGTRNLAV